MEMHIDGVTRFDPLGEPRAHTRNSTEIFRRVAALAASFVAVGAAGVLAFFLGRCATVVVTGTAARVDGAYNFYRAPMKVTKVSEQFFAIGFAVIVLMFACCAMALIAFAGIEFWRSVQPGDALTLTHRFDLILNCIAMLTIAMAAMELAHTIVEEEFDHESQLSAAERARRVLSRFLVVVIVSLAIESLVAIFKVVHDDPSKLSEAAYIAFAAAALLVAWGLFVKLGQRGEEPAEQI